MIYLIGGAPRAGKTTLVKHLVQRHPMHAISTDAIRYMLRRTLPSEAVDPDIFIHFKTDILNLWDKDHQATLEEQNQQSRALWPYMTEFIHSYAEDGVDLIIEGVAVLPEFAQNLGVNFHSIFLGNTSPGHVETILRQAHNDEHDWMRVLPDEKISRGAEFFGYMSEYFKASAASYGMMYQEISDDAFEQSLQAATEYLLSD